MRERTFLVHCWFSGPRATPVTQQRFNNYWCTNKWGRGPHERDAVGSSALTRQRGQCWPPKVCLAPCLGEESKCKLRPACKGSAVVPQPWAANQGSRQGRCFRSFYKIPGSHLTDTNRQMEPPKEMVQGMENRACSGQERAHSAWVPGPQAASPGPPN